jgi:GNAT superfamily N-acetyltransferase
MAESSLHSDYELHIGSPSVDDYLRIRANLGNLTLIHAAQAKAALEGSWFCIHITHKSNSETTIAMGRIVGDGGWYFSIADVAVLPDHQRKGLGAIVMATLIRCRRIWAWHSGWRKDRLKRIGLNSNSN